MVLDDLTELLRLTPAQVFARPVLHTDVLFEGIVVCPPRGRARAAAGRPRLQRASSSGCATSASTSSWPVHDPARGRRAADRAAGAPRDRRRAGARRRLAVAGSRFPRVPARAVVVSVLPQRPASPPPAMRWMGGAADACVALLADQADRRAAGVVPSIDEDPAWTITVSGDDPAQRRAHQALLTVADTRFGTRGVREEEGLGVAAPGAGRRASSTTRSSPRRCSRARAGRALHLLQPLDHRRDRRTLDLRSGVLYREQAAAPVALRSLRFASLARPGCFALRAEGAPEWMHVGTALIPPATDGTFERRQLGDEVDGRGAHGCRWRDRSRDRAAGAHRGRASHRRAGWPASSADPDGPTPTSRRRSPAWSARRVSASPACWPSSATRGPGAGTMRWSASTATPSSSWPSGSASSTSWPPCRPPARRWWDRGG